jgi:hypothetical protein
MSYGGYGRDGGYGGNGTRGYLSPESPEPPRELSEEQRRRIERRVADLRAGCRGNRQAVKLIPWMRLVQIAAAYLEDAPALLAEITRLRGELAAKGGIVE